MPPLDSTAISPNAPPQASTLMVSVAESIDSDAVRVGDLLERLDGRGVGLTLLAGLELGRQDTENFRETGYFDTIAPNTTSTLVPISNPRTSLPIDFRQSASYRLRYQPRAGEQLASLSATTASLDPEEFKNYEVGAKWDVSPSSRRRRTWRCGRTTSLCSTTPSERS